MNDSGDFTADVTGDLTADVSIQLPDFLARPAPGEVRHFSFTPIFQFLSVYTDFEFVSEARLNNYGDDRWELVSMSSLPNERFQFVFRRPR